MTEKNKGGRPTVTEPMVRMTISLPKEIADRLNRETTPKRKAVLIAQALREFWAKRLGDQ